MAAGGFLELADDGARQGPETLVREGGGDLGVVGLREYFADVFCWEDIYSGLVNPSGYENEEVEEIQVGERCTIVTEARPAASMSSATS